MKVELEFEDAVVADTSSDPFVVDITGGIGPQGSKGDKGDKGDTGETGPQGPKGDKGDKGDTGSQGIQGPVGPRGEQGIQGIQGEKGDKGDKGDTYTLTNADKQAIASLVVQMIDMSGYLRRTDYATESQGGTVKVSSTTGGNGIYRKSNGEIVISKAESDYIKAGVDNYRPIVPSKQHEAVFYGLAEAAGVDMKNSSNRVGFYTDEAKAAIRAMLGIT